MASDKPRPPSGVGTPSASGGPLKAWHLLLACLLTLAYRFWLVDHSGFTLFVDEAYYWGWAQDLAWGYYSKPPMVALLIQASTILFGDGLLGVKALAMVLFPVSAWLVFRLGSELFDAQTGLRAALLWNFSFASGLLGLFVTTDALLLCFWPLAAWLAWRALKRPHALTFAALGLVLGLGVLSKYTMLAFVFALPWLLYDLLRRQGGVSRAHWVGVLLAAGVCLLVLSPHLAWNLFNGAPTLRHTMEITVESTQQGGWATVGEFWAGQFLLLSPVPLLLLAWAGLRATVQFVNLRPASQQPGIQQPAPPSLRAVHFLLALALPLLVLSTVQAFNARANMNWAAPAYVSLALLFAHVAGRSTWRWWWGTALVLNIMLSTLVVHAQDIARITQRSLPSQWDVFARMRGWDTALAALAPAAAGHKALPVVGEGRTLLAHAAYHWRATRPSLLAWNPQGEVRDHYMLTTQMSQRTGQDMLLLLEAPVSVAMRDRFGDVTPLQSVRVATGPDRFVSVYLYLAQGFKGYGP